MAVLEELHRHRDLRLYRTWRGKIEKRGGRSSPSPPPASPRASSRSPQGDAGRGHRIHPRGRCYLRAASKTAVLHEYAMPDDGDPEDLALALEANPLKMIDRGTLERKRSSPS